MHLYTPYTTPRYPLYTPYIPLPAAGGSCPRGTGQAHGGHAKRRHAVDQGQVNDAHTKHMLATSWDANDLKKRGFNVWWMTWQALHT